MSALSLLQTRRFLPLFVAQTLGALNDNMFKNAMVVLILYQSTAGGPVMVALSGLAFILPYVLFSVLAGQLADACEKSRLIRLTKLGEVAIMAIGSLGFLGHNLDLLMAALFGLGIQATFFGPLKYAILPDHLAEGELIAGNGLIEAGTFTGILIGTIAGGLLGALDPWVVSGAGLGIAALGLAAAFFVPTARIAAPGLELDWNLWRETFVLMRQARDNRPVWLSILGLGWFWTGGATLLTEFPVVAREVLVANEHVLTLLLAVFAVGVGVGSLLCARVLHGEVSARLVPYAAFGISLFTWDFSASCSTAAGLASVDALLASVNGWRLLGDLFLLAFCGGLYSVPLYAIMQQRSAADCRSRMVACNNVMNAAFMVLGYAAAAALSRLGLSAPQILLLVAATNLAVTAGIRNSASW